MRLKRYLKKLGQFTIKEQINILLFSTCTFILSKLNKNVLDTYEVLSEIYRKGFDVKKTSESIMVTVEINDRDFIVSLKRDSSDALVLKQLILENEYAEVIEIFKGRGLTVRTMIDAGANIGLASIYFLAFYPKLKVIALEPSKDTYSRLVHNLAVNQLDSVKALETGLWNDNVLLQFDNNFRDKSDWSFRLIENKDHSLNTIEARDVGTILKENGWDQVDFLKIDIEGGEVAVFENQEAVKKWLPRVKVLAIEIHDEFDVREKIYALLKQNHFTLHETKSLTIAINSSLV